MEKHPVAPSWRLIGTVGEGTFCHKPCTGQRRRQERLSKSIADYMLYGPIFVRISRRTWLLSMRSSTGLLRTLEDRGTSLKPRAARAAAGRCSARSGRAAAVLKLLTPSAEYTDDYKRVAGQPAEVHLPDRLHHQAVL